MGTVPVPSPSSPAAEDVDWKTFTPESINHESCMARIWNGGKGGQCTKTKRVEGYDYCVTHKEKYVVHGRVDGPIPLKKLKEFIAASKKPQLSEEELAAKRAKRA